MEGPAGDQTLHRDARWHRYHTVPEHRLRRGQRTSPSRILLFYSNRKPEDAAFLAELQALEKENPNYKLIAGMTGMEKSHRPWHGE